MLRPETCKCCKKNWLRELYGGPCSVCGKEVKAPLSIEVANLIRHHPAPPEENPANLCPHCGLYSPPEYLCPTCKKSSCTQTIV